MISKRYVGEIVLKFKPCYAFYGDKNEYSNVYTKSQRIKRTALFDCFSHIINIKRNEYVKVCRG